MTQPTTQPIPKSIPGVLTDEAKSYILSLVLHRDRPQDLYFGLSYVPDTQGPVTYETLVQNEPVGARGYNRRHIPTESWTIVGTQASTDPVLYRNTGTEKWPKVNAVFLATDRATGGSLISWQFMGGERDMYPGDEYEATPSIHF